MSSAGADLREIRQRVRERVRRLHRITAGAVVVRGVVFGAAVAALLVAYSPLAAGPSAGLVLMVVAGLAAALPALLPRGAGTTAVLVLAVLGWLASSAYGVPVTLLRLVAQAGLLYLLHTSAALAAVVPYDALLAPGILLRWLARAVGVVALTGLFAVAAAVAAQYATGQTDLLVPLAGLAAVAALAAVLGHAWRR